MRRRHIALLIALAGLLLVNASGVTITHYGAPDDASGDPLSAQGIGNHDNVLAPLQSAALTKSFAVEHNIVLGQSFSVTSTTGDQYNLIYADTVPDIYQGKSLGQRIDIFDPNSVLGPTN